MTKKEKINFIITELNNLYPNAKCSLNFTKPYELLIATRLSAQCTDERVNIVTPALFAKYKSLKEFAEADFDDVCEIIHSCGFYRAKAQSIIEMSNQILNEFNGQVPDNIEDLTKLSGIGRKTANLIIGDVYKKPAVVADTHVIRITNLLGLSSSNDPKAVELGLKKILPPEESNDFCHRIVLHGRAVCIARRPKCDICSLKEVCKHYQTKVK